MTRIGSGSRRSLQALFLTFVAIAVIAYGAVDDVSVDLLAIVFAAIAVLAVRYPGRAGMERLRTGAIILLALLTACVVVQAVALPGHPFVNAAWSAVGDLVGVAAPTISVAPATTFDACIGLALPFLVFISGLALFQSDAEAMLLWRVLAYFGTAMAILGMFQFLVFPDMLLLGSKKYYLNSLTGSFVNRNTAGTFFGITLLLDMGLLFFYLRELVPSRLFHKLINLDFRRRDPYGILVVHVAACFVVAVALFLTTSRGAVIATFVAVILAIVLMAMRRMTAHRARATSTRMRTWGIRLAGVLLVGVLFALFADKALHRMMEQVADGGRWCAFASTIKAIKDNWLFGTGYGAFTDTFPAYRNADCVGIFGLWDHAHNSFLEGYLGLGLPFAVIAAVIYATLVTVFVIGMRRRRQFRFGAVMASAALVLVSLHALVDFSIQIPGLAIFFAAVMVSGLTMSMGSVRE